MKEEIFIPISMFLMIFGIVYLFLSTRHKERLALIETGVDANIFISDKRQGRAPFWNIVILNLSLLLIGVASGIFTAAILTSMGVNEEVAYPGTIFLTAGIGLFVSFTMTKKLDREE